jgi:hypothetical protein
MAAYRAGVKLKDERRGVDADYSRKRGIVHAEIMAPDGCAPFLLDRECLWNYVERIENRKDAQLARELNVALPHELTGEQRLELVRGFIRQEFVSRGMVADFAMHVPVPEKGDDPRNFHAHILLTLRQAEATGLRRVKTREWNSDEMLVGWRAAWAKCQNEALERGGHQVRVDHRSLAVRKAEAKAHGDLAGQLLLDREPEIHVGPKARKAGRAGPPKSRDRVVGPSRVSADGKKKRREVRYREIDKGSRGEWNIARLVGNAKNAAEQLARIEQRMARFRKRMRYYNRMTEMYSGQRTIAGRRKWTPWKKKVDVAGMFVMSDWERRVAHYRQRKEQVAWLVDQLDRVFLGLLGIRESQLMRRTVWSNRLKRWRNNNIEPIRGGGRIRKKSILTRPTGGMTNAD